MELVMRSMKILGQTRAPRFCRDRDGACAKTSAICGSWLPFDYTSSLLDSEPFLVIWGTRSSI